MITHTMIDHDVLGNSPGNAHAHATYQDSGNDGAPA